MQSRTIFSNYRNDESIKKIDITELTSDTLPETESPLNSSLGNQGEIWLIPICCLVISFLLFLGKRIESNKRANQLKTIHKVHNIPCLNCSFFKNEPYLKCAVHPDKVLKKEAMHCVDYCSQDSKKT